MRAFTLPAPQRLALARTLAWALLIGGWLVLGEAGQRQLPLWAGGTLPLALWLASIGGLLAGLQSVRLTVAALRAGLLLGAAALALLTPPGALPVLVAALAWSVLVVGASRVVKALRRTVGARPPAPLLPAAAGAFLAWVVVSHGDGRWAPAAAGLAAVVLALLLPRGAAAAPACRAGLFDCSLPLPDPSRWRRGADWPQQAAVLAMLPMMATLPAMAGWCRSDWGLSPATGVLWHLAAMLLPALLLRRWLARAALRAARHAVTLLLLASGVVLWARPGLGGLMVATLLQAAAWSLAWAGPMLRPAAAQPTQASAGSPALQALATAAAVLALGTATAAHGPDTLRAVQGLLAALALAGAAGSALGMLACSRPSEKHP